MLTIEPLALDWIAKFLSRYEAMGAQFPDAAPVYLAEWENIRTVSLSTAATSSATGSSETGR